MIIILPKGGLNRRANKRKKTINRFSFSAQYDEVNDEVINEIYELGSPFK